MTITQRTQTVCNGYFGGYIGKRQPTGALETKKCVEKLFTLRAKMQGRGKAAQLRAASGRLITDIEMNSTYRGAVEIFNLCRNLRMDDVLFAECIRTFNEKTIDGRMWMGRLEAACTNKAAKNTTLLTFVPETKRPNVRTDRSRVNVFEAYGLRPQTYPWKLLSAYEFWRFWNVVPLLLPTYYVNRGIRPRTIWTEEGQRLTRTQEYKEGKRVAKPGIHFVAVSDVQHDPTYYLFPEHPTTTFTSFRHAWAIERNARPYVVVVEGLKLPNPSRSPTYNAQYCSLFFRPWTLLWGDTLVPNFELIGLDRTSVEIAYDNEKPPAPKAARMQSTKPAYTSIHQATQWHNAWNEYIRGNIVSESARDLIQSFLLKTMAASYTRTDEESDADVSSDDDAVPRLEIAADQFHKLLETTDTISEERPGSSENAVGRTHRLRQSVSDKHMQRKAYITSIRIGEALWKTPEICTAAADRKKPGHMYEDCFDQHISALTNTSGTHDSNGAPFDENRNAAANWFRDNAETHLDEVMAKIMRGESSSRTAQTPPKSNAPDMFTVTGELIPNEEQTAFLKHLVRRLKLEVLEMRTRQMHSSKEDGVFQRVIFPYNS